MRAMIPITNTTKNKAMGSYNGEREEGRLIRGSEEAIRREAEAVCYDVDHGQPLLG